MERIPERRKREAVAAVRTTVHDIYGNAMGRKKAGAGGGGKNSHAVRKGRASRATRPPFCTRPSDVSEDKENAMQSPPQQQQQQQRASPPATKGGDVSLSMGLVGERLKGVKVVNKRVSPKSTAVVF
jgi:hypothetical protein